jgi:hypothetical protein
MSASKVSALLPDSFGGFKLGSRQFSIGATGDSVTGPISFPYGQFTVRKIRLRNPSASVTGAALGIWTAASQGGTNIVANASLTNLSASLTFQEATLAAAAGTTIFTSSTTFYVNIGTASSGNTVYIDFYGDPVTDQL